MPVVISLLRGVNVGGHNKIGMEALKRLFASLGLSDVRTYVQSGNVVFRTKETNLARLAIRIEEAIEKEFAFRPQVMLRTPTDLRRVIATNPFADREGIDPRKYAVIFLAAEPGPSEIAQARGIKAESEELHIDRLELYIYFANGMARPKLSPAVLEKKLKTAGTGRNWNTVTKLLALSEELEALEAARGAKKAGVRAKGR